MKTRHLWMTGAVMMISLVPTISALAQDAPPTPPTLLPPAAQGAPTVTLRYKYKTGQVIRYKMTQDMNQVMSGMPGTAARPMAPFNTHTESIMKMTVLNVRASDGAATIKNNIESMTMTLNGKPMDMPQASKSMLTTGTTMTLLPDGKIAPSAQDSKSMSNALGFDPTAMMSPQSGGYLPKGPVKIGDIWKATTEVMKLHMFVQSKLIAVSQVEGDSVADIKQYVSMNGTMVIPTQGMTVKNTLKMESNGMTHFDVDSGMMNSYSSDTTMTSAIKMPNPKSSQTPISMRSNGTIHMALERIPETTP